MTYLKKALRVVLLLLAASGLVHAETVTYEHDAQGRVSKATYQNGTYVIYSYDANGNRTSAVVTVPPDVTAPTAPATLTATRPSHTTAGLTWAASTDIVGVTGYRVERCSGATCTNFAQIATPTVTTYSDTALTSGTTYRYRVRAADAAGNLSGYSPIATATALETTAPSTPASLTATATSQSQINLSWPASTDNVGVLNYRIERCTGASCTNYAQIATSTTNSYSNTGLTASTAYRYRVNAVDAAGNVSGYSPVASATTLDTTAPTAPGTPTFSNLTASSATANWAASTDNVAVVGYDYRLNTGSWISLGNVTSVGLTGLTAGTAYNFQVRARDAAGNLSTVSSSTFSLADATAPGAPGTPTFSNITSTGATASWAAATDNVAVTGYEYRLNSGAWQTLGNVLTVNVTGLTQATSYSFQVRARDGANNLGAASSASFTTRDATAPGMPGALSFGSITMTSATVSWGAATDNVAVTGYDYQVNSGAWQSLGNVLSVGLSGLSAVTTYTVAVRARDADGNTGPARSGSFSTPDQGAPTVPTNLAASAPNSNRVNLTWSASSDNVGVVGYRIYRNNALLASSDTTSYSDTSVVGTTTYVYRVSAYDAAGNESGQSDARSITTPDTIAPTAASGLSAVAASPSQINLSWTAGSDTGGSGVAGYQVFRNGGHVATVGGTSHSDTGLSAGGSYTYYVVTVDGAGNTSGASNSAGATTPIPLGASLNKTEWNWYRAGNNPPSVGTPVVVTSSGGAGGYSYAWEFVSGDTQTSIVSPTSNSTIWTRPQGSLSVEYVSFWRCRVRDAAGTDVYTANVRVGFFREVDN